MLTFTSHLSYPKGAASVRDRLTVNGQTGAQHALRHCGSVALAGSFRVLLDDGTDVTPSSALRQALLAVLVVSPNQARSRKSLQSLFWADSDSEKAAASLRSTLYQVRQDLAAFGPEILLTDRMTIRLQTNRIRPQQTEIGQDFLEGLDIGLKGCEPFEDWLRLMRAGPRNREPPATVKPTCPPARFSALGLSPPLTTVPRLALLCPKTPDGRPASKHLAARVIHELASGLAAWRSFAVLAPHSSFSVSDDFGIPHDNTALRADYCLSGQLISDDAGAARIDLCLVHLPSRTILWSGRFPLSAAEIGPALARFTARIVVSIADRLEDHTHETLRLKTDPSALLCFLTGRSHQHRSDLPYVRRARAAFQKALLIDASFAPAHARIAETLYNEWVLRGGGDKDLLEAAKVQASRAVALDPTEPTGHWVSGAVSLYLQEFDEVAAAFTSAEELAPHDSGLILEYADALSHLGDHMTAEQRFSHAVELNPLPPENLWWVGVSIAFNAGAFEVAANRCDQMRDTEVGVGLRAVSYAMAGRLPEAGHWAKRLDEALPGATAEMLSEFPPNRDKADYRRNYTEGLRIARSVRGGKAWRASTI